MYPTNATELIALLAVLAPVLVATISGRISAQARAAQSRRDDWTRIRDLVAVLNNKNGDHGSWSQTIAAQELGDFWSYREAIVPLIESAYLSWGSEGMDAHPELMEALRDAKKKLSRLPSYSVVPVNAAATLIVCFSLLIYYCWPREKPGAINKEQRCLSLQSDMFATHPRRSDSRELFKTLACEHDGDGPIYAPPTDRERLAGKPLPWGGYPPPAGRYR